jgi:hypothetical protein
MNALTVIQSVTAMDSWLTGQEVDKLKRDHNGTYGSALLIQRKQRERAAKVQALQEMIHVATTNT